MVPGDPDPPMYSKFPEGDTVMLMGKIPIGYVAPGVSAPLPESIEYVVTLFEPAFTQYKNAPDASVASMSGVVPAVVRGVTSVKAPVLSMLNNEISLSAELATYRNFFDECTTIECAPVPAVNGLSLRAVSVPEFGSSR